MIVYRIGKLKHATDLSGEGARLHGGRWNHKLTPCLYTSESRALAVLEYTVNVNIDDIPRALSITTIEIPSAKIFNVSIASLPGDWMTSPSPASTKDFGTALLKKMEYAVFRFPSSILAYEFNYIINPLHPGHSALNIIDVQDFVYDVRIKYNES